VERAEAEAIYDAGREVVVEVLLGMDRQIWRLMARVERLERELAKDSRDSSWPPSSDPPGEKPKRREEGRSPRRQGAQPGHGCKGRDLLPAWAVDEVIEHWRAGCGCGHVFCEFELVAVGDPARHRVEELPRITTLVTEHRC
jgi:transposase